MISDDFYSLSDDSRSDVARCGVRVAVGAIEAFHAIVTRASTNGPPVVYGVDAAGCTSALRSVRTNMYWPLYPGRTHLACND